MELSESTTNTPGNMSLPPLIEDAKSCFNTLRSLKDITFKLVQRHRSHLNSAQSRTQLGTMYLINLNFLIGSLLMFCFQTRSYWRRQLLTFDDESKFAARQTDLRVRKYFSWPLTLFMSFFCTFTLQNTNSVRAHSITRLSWTTCL